jgi:uncharacterized protein YndB with AHSA1/START domain
MFDKVLKGIIALSLITGLLFLSLGLGNGKHTIKTEIEVNAPVEMVYSYILDDNNAQEWVSGFKSRKLISGEKGQPGSKSELIFIENDRAIKMMETIIEVVPNTKYVFLSENEMMTGQIELQFKPSDGGTLLTEIHQFEVNGFVSKAMTKLALNMIKRGKQEMYETLKLQLETK